MEVVPALSDASPFQRRDVAEWTHRDRLTGVLEKARVETDRWAATTANSKHAYGKVVDSRDRSLPDGSAHQRQRQQLEVFQTKGPGGSLQVIRTQTVTSTNSSSSWRGPTTLGTLPAITQDFENLQLSLNPIDVSSEKNKASVGRSGSIGARRPPSRPRSLVGKIQATPTTQDRPSSPAQPVARLCHQARDQSARSSSGDQSPRGVRESRSSGDQSPRGPRESRSSSDQSPRGTRESRSSSDQSVKTVTSSVGRDLSASPSLNPNAVTLNGHLSVSRKKSSSIEDLHNGVSEERDDSDDGFKRSSKVRRSLQFPLKKLEARGGVCKLLQELEESSKRVSSDGRIARKSFEALENVLRRNISLASSEDKEDRERYGDRHEGDTGSEDFSPHSVNSISIDEFTKKFNNSRNKFMLEKRHSFMDPLDKTYQDTDEEQSPVSEGKNLSKRHSFVTVESLKEVRGRLKHLNSPLDGLDAESGMEELEDHDDGIGTEDAAKSAEVPQLRVKSYVFGLEGTPRPNRLPVLGTGSLESRTSNKTSSSGSRSDEWYNRRKSYGFESVHGDETHSRSSALISKFEDKTRLTSTDSGICRSSEQFVFPSWKRKQEPDGTKPSETEILQVSHSIPLKAIEDRIPTLDANKEDVRKGRTTFVTFSSKGEQARDSYSNGKQLDSLHYNGEVERSQRPFLLNKTSNLSTNDSNRLASQPVTVSIPVIQQDTSPSVVSRRLFFQQLSQGTSLSIEKPWTLQMNKGENQIPSIIGSRKIDADDWWRNPQMLVSSSSRDVSEDLKVTSKISSGVLKRHSIAVDTSWDSFNNLNRSVHENLESESVLNEPCYRPSQLSDNEVKRHSIAVDKLNYLQDDPSRADSENFGTRKQKRVEFCKTEVHFAAEPGRFNIVETDEKPPPTNMFRRRRRHSTPAPDPSKNAGNLPVVRFGDSVYEKQLLGGTEDMDDPSLATGEPAPDLPALPVRVHEEVYTEESVTDVKHILPASAVEEDDDHCIIESSLDPAPRSILKNYKKPQPYLTGDNEGSYLSSGEQKEEKWGVRLRPVAHEQPAPCRAPPLRDEVMPAEYSGQSELQKLLRSLRPAHPNRGKAGSSRSDHRLASDCSVAERVRQVEQVTSEARGFSTRVNFGAGEATAVDEESAAGQRLFRVNDQQKPVWQRREEAIAARDTSKLKGTDYAMLIGENCHVTSVSRSLREKEVEGGGAPRGGTTTTITIDLSQPPSSHGESNAPNSGGFQVNGISRISPHEVLQSPSLIMRTFHKPNLRDQDSSRRSAYTSSSVSSTEDCAQRCELNVDEGSRSKASHANLRDVENRAESTADGQLRRNRCPRTSPVCAQNGHGGDSERESVEEVVAVNQLDAWRALYCDVDSELSDDSERADEEVRSYMSGEGDGASSEVSGSWSRATGLKNLRTTEYSTGNASADWLDESQPRPQQHSVATTVLPSYGADWSDESQSRPQQRVTKAAPPSYGADWLDDPRPRPQQRSVATAVLPSYGECERLRAVETLVSTRSGQPKITSISLRYGEDSEPFRFTSKTAISAPPRSVSSTRLGPAHEELRPASKDRKTFLDITSEVASERVSSARHSESLTRGLNSSSFEKKPLGHKRGNSPPPKSFPSSRIPPDALTITEATPEISVTAKQLVHSEASVKTASFFDKELTSRSSQFSPSKPTTVPQATATKPQTSQSSSRMLSSFDRRAPTSSSLAGSQSPKLSRAAHQHSERTAPTSHRSSPRSLGGMDVHTGGASSSVKLDTITATSRTSFSNMHHSSSHSARTSITDGHKASLSDIQHVENKDSLAGATVALHIKESHETSQGILGKSGRLSNGGGSLLLSSTGKISTVGSESRRVVRSTSKSPTPTKKVTPPSKNSKTKDFIGRVGSDSPVYQNSRKSVSPSNTLSSSETVRCSRSHEQSPIYQNCDTFTEEANPSSQPDKYDCGLDRIETDSAILAELTRAADEILQAVNGYTDEDSRRGSSDDDHRRSRDRRSTPLGTIDEAGDAPKTNGSGKRTQRVSSRTKLGPTSSTSSVESFTRETRRALVKPERSGSRAARLVQRANSRELLLQTNASSSEDVASGTETKKQRAPPPRRSRTSSSAANKDASSTSKSRDKQKDGGDGTRTRERTSSSRTKTRETSDAREARRKVVEAKNHPVKEKTIPAASGLTGGRERSSHARHTTSSTSRTKKAPSVQEKTSAGAGKRRTEAPVQI